MKEINHNHPSKETLKRDQAINQAREFAPEAIQFLINLARGKLLLTNQAGEMATVYLGAESVHQMRMAVNSILDRAGVVNSRLQDDDEDGRTEIIGFRILDSE